MHSSCIEELPNPLDTSSDSNSLMLKPVIPGASRDRRCEIQRTCTACGSRRPGTYLLGGVTTDLRNIYVFSIWTWRVATLTLAVTLASGAHISSLLTARGERQFLQINCVQTKDLNPSTRGISAACGRWKQDDSVYSTIFMVEWGFSFYGGRTRIPTQGQSSWKAADPSTPLRFARMTKNGAPVFGSGKDWPCELLRVQ